jgi:hypothetical protein
MQVSNWRSALNQGLIRIKIREIWIRITGPDQATNNHKSNTWDFRSCPLLVVGRSLPPASNPATGPATHPGEKKRFPRSGQRCRRVSNRNAAVIGDPAAPAPRRGHFSSSSMRWAADSFCSCKEMDCSPRLPGGDSFASWVPPTQLLLNESLYPVCCSCSWVKTVVCLGIRIWCLWPATGVEFLVLTRLLI